MIIFEPSLNLLSLPKHRDLAGHRSGSIYRSHSEKHPAPWSDFNEIQTDNIPINRASEPTALYRVLRRWPITFYSTRSGLVKFLTQSPDLNSFPYKMPIFTKASRFLVWTVLYKLYPFPKWHNSNTKLRPASGRNEFPGRTLLFLTEQRRRKNFLLLYADEQRLTRCY